MEGGEGMAVKQYTCLVAMMLFSATALADVYRCQTPEGIRYADKPCAEGAASGTLAAPPAPPPQFLPQKANVHDVDAVPLRDPSTQRALYREFLARPNPRAFAICQDGGAMIISGDAAFVDRQMSGVRGGCRMYAVNDEVVW